MQASDRAKSDEIKKDPDEWTTGDEPMTPSQASYLKTLCEQADDDKITPKISAKQRPPSELMR
ncbi:hypothetical protein X740_31775 [Mesorhizobium sp. LNHC221B00]|uniref:DUF3072 domain-containing protein n=1 Tax=Mesorhizobium sp. LNHC221B00 TaxID=1287233 RepID=UPI0003CE21CE|nr:hypothetical protein X740_31775 [Mesorhizobium sp. LNHC221B00]